MAKPPAYSSYDPSHERLRSAATAEIVEAPGAKLVVGIYRYDLNISYNSQMLELELNHEAIWLSDDSTPLRGPSEYEFGAFRDHELGTVRIPPDLTSAVSASHIPLTDNV